MYEINIDHLTLRYNHTPASFPKSCDGCGERFSVQLGGSEQNFFFCSLPPSPA